MATQQTQASGGGDNHGEDVAAESAGQAQINTSGTGDLLDEIDALLDNNAEEFVKSFVQKGGQ